MVTSTAHHASIATSTYQQLVTTNADGSFTFEDLPPGSYVFGVNLTRRPVLSRQGVLFFFPGTAIVQEAAVIELKPGDHKDIGTLRLIQK